MKLSSVVEFLDSYLKVREIKKDHALNGLQVGEERDIGKIAFAVDASLEAIERARREGAELLVVHHGLIWEGKQPITGLIYGRLKALIEAGVALYAAHLPVDVHPEVGNNAQLAALMGLEVEGTFGHEEGWLAPGLFGALPESRSLERLVRLLESQLAVRCTVLRFGKARVRRVAVCSGAADTFVREAAEKGMDVYVTGEAGHAAYHFAKEGALNVVFAGHYGTETVGMKALAEMVKKKCGLETVFLDLPTGF